jgi:hexosaminidase
MRIHLLTSLLILASIASAEHRTLLPLPQEVRYGGGQLQLKGISIRLVSSSAPEDRFAAGRLSSILAEIAGREIEVREEAGAGPSIMLRRTHGVDALPVPGERPGPDSRESYSIKVKPAGCEVTARSSAGLYYGVETLRQLVEGRGESAVLPEVEIRDWPSLAYRGFMMDVSHAQLPKIEELKEQIDFLSRWKANQYLFYSEASIEMDGFPLLMANARYTKDQVREVIAYGRERHVDVFPNVELYGHLHDLFRLEHYADMSVIPHGGEFNRQDPRIKPLLENWIDQLARLFPSPFFHIGFDETWLLEFEARKMQKSPGDLYLGQLKNVVAILAKHGKQPLAYADMLQKHTDVIPNLPKGLIIVPWHYDALSDADYERLLGPFANNGVDMIVQSAVLNWNWLVPDYENTFKNIDVLLAAGKKYKGIGFYQSGWTDDTQVLMRLTWPAMAYPAVAAWQSKPMERDNFFTTYAEILYPPAASPHVASGLQALARAEVLLQSSMGGSTIRAFWANPFRRGMLAKAEANQAGLHDCRLAAEDAQEHFRAALKLGADPAALNTLLTGARMVDYAAMRYVYAAEIAGFWKECTKNPDPRNVRSLLAYETSSKYHTRISDLLDEITELREKFRECWLNEYTPFRLGLALGKYDAEFQFWWRAQRSIEDVASHFKQGDTLPALDSVMGEQP